MLPSPAQPSPAQPSPAQPSPAQPKLTYLSIAVVLAASSFATGCNPVQDFKDAGKTVLKSVGADPDDPCSKLAQYVGTAAGVGVGLAIGNKLGQGDVGAMVAGAAVGGVLGGLIGQDIDDKRCRLHKASEIAKGKGLELQYKQINESILPVADKKDYAATDVGIEISVAALQENIEPFKANSAELTPNAEAAYKVIAASYGLKAIEEEKKEAKTPLALQALEKTLENRKKLLAMNKLVITGHSDDSGTSAQNAKLSEERARVVANIFKDAGVPSENIYYQGAGDVYPIADNRTSEGRAKNRRVQIAELPNEQSLKSYLTQQPKNAQFYRTKVESLAQSRTQSGASTVARGVSKQQPSGVDKITNAGVSKLFDLGGVPLSSYQMTNNIGQLKTSMLSSILPISNANATNQYVYQSACALDQYREETSVKKLSNGGVLQVMASMTPLKGWQAKSSSYAATTEKAKLWLTAFDSNNGYSGLSQTPKLKVKTDTATKDFTARANVYESETSIQYRVFFGEKPADCMDVFFSKQGNNNPAYMVYDKQNTIYAVDMSFN